MAQDPNEVLQSRNRGISQPVDLDDEKQKAMEAECLYAFGFIPGPISKES